MNKSSRCGSDHTPRRRGILIEESLAQSAPGICEEGVDPPAADGEMKFIDPVDPGQIGLYRSDLGARSPELLCCCRYLRFVGGNNEVEPIFCGAFGELVSDPG